MFDAAGHLEELRCWPTPRLQARRQEVVAEQRRLRTEELLLTRVLDERGKVDPTVGADGESARSVRDKLETARRLGSLPYASRDDPAADGTGHAGEGPVVGTVRAPGRGCVGEDVCGGRRRRAGPDPDVGV